MNTFGADRSQVSPAYDDLLVCPECRAISEPPASLCLGCGLALKWLELVADDFRAALISKDQQVAPAMPAIEKLKPQDVPLRGRNRIWIGRRRRSGDDPHVELDDPRVAMDHCVVVQQPGTSHYWLADAGSPQGTFVNRCSVRSVRLQSGDLVQTGPFAWIFAGEDGYLVPVGRIDCVNSICASAPESLWPSQAPAELENRL